MTPTEEFDAKQLFLVIQEECVKLGYTSLTFMENVHDPDDETWIGARPVSIPDDLTLWQNVIRRLIRFHVAVPRGVVADTVVIEKCPYCAADVTGLNDCHNCLAERNRGQYIGGLCEVEKKTGWIGYVTNAYRAGEEPPVPLAPPLSKWQKVKLWLCASEHWWSALCSR